MGKFTPIYDLPDEIYEGIKKRSALVNEAVLNCDPRIAVAALQNVIGNIIFKCAEPEKRELLVESVAEGIMHSFAMWEAEDSQRFPDA